MTRSAESRSKVVAEPLLDLGDPLLERPLRQPGIRKRRLERVETAEARNMLDRQAGVQPRHNAGVPQALVVPLRPDVVPEQPIEGILLHRLADRLLRPEV